MGSGCRGACMSALPPAAATPCLRLISSQGQAAGLQGHDERGRRAGTPQGLPALQGRPVHWRWPLAVAAGRSLRTALLRSVFRLQITAAPPSLCCRSALCVSMSSMRRRGLGCHAAAGASLASGWQQPTSQQLATTVAVALKGCHMQHLATVPCLFQLAEAPHHQAHNLSEQHLLVSFLPPLP